MENLKIGMKLYARHYWSDGRKCWSTYIISKINRKSVSMRGYGWNIPKENIGKVYFTSKKKLIKTLIRKHKAAIREIIWEQITPVKQEIKYLERKLSEVT